MDGGTRGRPAAPSHVAMCVFISRTGRPRAHVINHLAALREAELNAWHNAEWMGLVIWSVDMLELNVATSA